MKKEEFFDDEQLKKQLSPHPLSFMNFQALPIFLVVWGVLVAWFMNFSEWAGAFTDSFWLSIFFWGIVLLLAGIIASLLTVRWIIFGLFLAVFLGGLIISLWLNIGDGIRLFAPAYTIALSIAGFLIVEFYRRARRYYITNHRIITQGGINVKRRMSVNYENISNISEEQGILGQIFNFGTIIPISSSGLGLGEDKSFAAGGVSAGSKAKLFGLVGGGQDVTTPKSRSYHELHGVHPFNEVRKLVNQMHHEGGTVTQYQQEQVDFQKEQVDIQKQMRDLLKMQKEKNKESESNEDEEDEKAKKQ
jgi:membrane protein YdbS with pleckstrin-like domain